jgi:hypothetical protein
MSEKVLLHIVCNLPLFVDLLAVFSSTISQLFPLLDVALQTVMQSASVETSLLSDLSIRHIEVETQFVEPFGHRLSDFSSAQGGLGLSFPLCDFLDLDTGYKYSSKSFDLIS